MGRLTVWFIIGLALSVSGCGRPAGPDVVAVVAGEPLQYQQFSDYVAANVGSRAESLNSKVLSALFDEFLDQTAADTLAEGDVPAGTPADRRFEVWLDTLVVEPPSEAEVRARYRRQRGRFALPRRAVVRQIVLAERSQAGAARQQILDGAAFAAVADRLQSEGEYGPAGGLQGTFARGDLPPDVAEVVFALEPSTVSEIVEMEHGYALFAVDRFLEAEEKGFSEAREVVARELAAERRQQVLEHRVAAFRTPENVRIYPANLPFEYGGVYEDLIDEVD